MASPAFLVIDDDEADRREIGRLLRRTYRDSPVQVADGEGTTVVDFPSAPDIALVDYGLPGTNGIALMEDLRRSWPDAAFIIMTGQGDEEIARDSIKKGAVDYIPKSKINDDSLRRMVDNSLTMAQMQRRLAEQQRELEIFADVMVHDLKSPIRSVNFLVEELQYGLDDDDRPAIENVMRLMKRSATQMGSLVDSLACHVLTTKELPFEKSSARDVIGVAVEALAPSIAESGAEVRLEFDDMTLCCCPPQLSQLFQNVIGNAIKYASDKRPEVVVTTEIDADTVLFRVADNGIGIPEEFRERAFEPFKRAPGASGISGTGLGLATCRKVAERHKGRIWCESEVGMGTTVLLRLPLPV